MGGYAVLGDVHNCNIIQEVYLRQTMQEPESKHSAHFSAPLITRGSSSGHITAWTQFDSLKIHLFWFENAPQQVKQRGIATTAGALRCRELHFWQLRMNCTRQIAALTQCYLRSGQRAHGPRVKQRVRHSRRVHSKSEWTFPS